jgi:hypothetical protein
MTGRIARQQVSRLTKIVLVAGLLAAATVPAHADGLCKFLAVRLDAEARAEGAELVGLWRALPHDGKAGYMPAQRDLDRVNAKMQTTARDIGGILVACADELDFNTLRFLQREQEALHAQ